MNRSIARRIKEKEVGVEAEAEAEAEPARPRRLLIIKDIFTLSRGKAYRINIKLC